MNQYQRGFNAGYKAASVERDAVMGELRLERESREILEKANDDLVFLIESSKNQNALFFVTEDALNDVRNNTHANHVIRMVDPKRNKNAVAVYQFPAVLRDQSIHKPDAFKCDGNHPIRPCADKECWAREADGFCSTCCSEITMCVCAR